MNLRKINPTLAILTLLLGFIFVLACSTSSKVQTKNVLMEKEKKKILEDKEIVFIDQKEYVKVLNPNASGEWNQPKYLYIPVDEYLSKRESFSPVTVPKEEIKKESSIAFTKPPGSHPEKSLSTAPPLKPPAPVLRIKVLVVTFDSRVTEGEEAVGDWVVEKLMNEVNRKSQQVLFTDYQMVKSYLEKKGVDQRDFTAPNVLRSLNDVFGIQVLVVGQLSGPYIFRNKTPKDQEETSMSIIKIDMSLVDTLSGKTLKNVSVNNPIFATKGKGSFSEEKAKTKAIDLAISDLGRSLVRELDKMDWYCRIARVEGEDVYMNAGKLTGLKVGDVMEIYKPAGFGKPGELKGKIQISAFFGIDASVARLIQGNLPDVNDLLKPVKNEGT
jgi:hypothetical protein